METTVSIDILNKYPKVDEEEVERLLEQEFRKSDRKIVVLDDDPTGVQRSEEHTSELQSH